MDRLAVAQLGAMSRLGSGGQAEVYTAPGIRTNYAAAMVYKKYKPNILALLDITTLESMPAHVEALPMSEALELLSLAAWPFRLVEETPGIVSGFVMPAIPPQFRVNLRLASGTVKPQIAEFQHLLNSDDFLARRGIAITDRGRYLLLAATARALSILHRQHISVGDLSPKNLLFALTPEPAVYFIDCDAMRFQNRSVTAQLETPDWDVHSACPGEELATPATDTYKLGLLALRLLSGDQATRDPARLPAGVPDTVRRLVRDALATDPAIRPAPVNWPDYLIAAAARASTTPPQSTPLRPPPAGGRTAHPSTAPTGSVGYRQFSGQGPNPMAVPPNQANRSAARLTRIGLALAAAAVIAILVAALHNASSPANQSPGPSEASAVSAPTAQSAAPAQAGAPAPLPAAPTAATITRCGTGSLNIGFVGATPPPPAGMALQIQFQNISQQSCTLAGPPVVEMSGDGGDADPGPFDETLRSEDDTAATTVTLGPGQTTTSTISQIEVRTPSDPSTNNFYTLTPGRILVTPPGETTPATVAWPWPGYIIYASFDSTHFYPVVHAVGSN